MGQSLRATLGATIIFGSITALIAWSVHPVGAEVTTTWIVRIVSSALVIASAGLLIRGKIMKNKAPDLLARVSSPYFERNGLCFAVVPELADGRGLISIYFQNRYDRPCKGTISLVPTNVAFKDVSGLPTFWLDLSVEGGEFGKASRVWSPPLEHQKKAILWDVIATSSYPTGRGTLLRLRDGMRVGAERSWPAAAQFFAFLVGIHAGKPARLKLQFPQSAYLSPDSRDWERKTLWKPGQPQ